VHVLSEQNPVWQRAATRKRLRIAAVAIALQMGRSRGYVGRIERGETTDPEGVAAYLQAVDRAAAIVAEVRQRLATLDARPVVGLDELADAMGVQHGTR